MDEIRCDLKALAQGQTGIAQQQAVLTTRFDGLERRFDGLDDRVVGLAGKVDGLPALVARFDLTDTTVKELRPRLESLDRWRSWTLGLGAGIAALAGGLAGVVGKALAGSP